ncbi:MAG TPA: hypothetical protein ENI86_01420, partial [Acidimicrobiales bacterium]|nr:hypothetical protein [Acidimicrobiales bacterium]
MSGWSRIPMAVILVVAAVLVFPDDPLAAEPAAAVSTAMGTANGAISAGTGNTCAIDTDLQLRCWGQGTNGQLGQGSTTSIGDNPGEMGDNLPAIDLGTGHTAARVATTYSRTCAILDDGSLKCWGNNFGGSLGQGNTNNLGDQPNEMGDNLPSIDLGTGRTAVMVVGGLSHVCALLDNGTVKCWGHNTAGQLGQGHTNDIGDNPGEMGDNLPSIDLGTGRTAVAIAAGSHHTCAILDDGSLKCWGANTSAQLGLGDAQNRGDQPGEMGDNLPAVNLGTGRTAVAVSSYFEHTCVILDNGSTKCWGNNFFGELGIGVQSGHGATPESMGDNLPVVDLGTGRTAVSLAVGTETSCALLDNGTVKCWGQGFLGGTGQGNQDSLGDGPGEMGDDLPPVDLGTGHTATAISAGGGSVCVVLEDASLKCWGSNSSGKLGLGDQDNRGDQPNEMGDDLPAIDLPPIPSAPSASQLDVTPTPGAVSMALVWTKPTDTGTKAGITGYRIERKAGDSKYEEVAVAGPAETGYTDTDVEPRTFYTYRLFPLNGLGPGPFSTSSATSPAGWVACHSAQPTGYWLGETDGTIYPFGDADTLGNTTLASGTTLVDTEATPTGCGYWSLRTDGAIEQFGDAPDLGDLDLSTLQTGENLASFSPTPTGQGLWAFTDRGRVLTL